jgi:hypothetical protein
MTGHPAPAVSARLVGVGLGPGDPRLVPEAAVDLLAAADVVFVPAGPPGGGCPAERTALHYAEAWRVEPVPSGGPDDRAAGRVAGWFADHPGGLAVFAAFDARGTGPAFDELAAAVRRQVGELHVRVVGRPGGRAAGRDGVARLAATVAAIGPVDPAARDAAAARLDRMTKPPGALGRVEDVAVTLAGIAGTCPPPCPNRPRSRCSPPTTACTPRASRRGRRRSPRRWWPTSWPAGRW